ncbi:MAG: PAS domain S-box protein [Pseudolabrys sp.]
MTTKEVLDDSASDQAEEGADAAFGRISRENQLILRAAGEGIYGVNAEGKTTFVNPAAERMLGWTAENWSGTICTRLCITPTPTARPITTTIARSMPRSATAAVHQVDHEMFWRKDGTSFWVDYTSTPIRDNGVLIGAVIVFRDVTQRHEADGEIARGA